jgi:hypothetical protein
VLHDIHRLACAIAVSNSLTSISSHLLQALATTMLIRLGCIFALIIALSASFQPDPDCRKLDLLFILDNSGSITSNNFELMKEFTSNLVKQLKSPLNDIRYVEGMAWLPSLS